MGILCFCYSLYVWKIRLCKKGNMKMCSTVPQLNSILGQSKKNLEILHESVQLICLELKLNRKMIKKTKLHKSPCEFWIIFSNYNWLAPYWIVRFKLHYKPICRKNELNNFSPHFLRSWKTSNFLTPLLSWTNRLCSYHNLQNSFWKPFIICLIFKPKIFTELY